jgi:hypothetical protein
MEPEGLLTCSQEPTLGPYPKPDESSLYKVRILQNKSLRMH